MKMKTRPVCLFIMDGYGLNPDKKGNAIEIANEGVVKELAAKYPSATLGASGLCVGLPDGQMGNSDVGRRSQPHNSLICPFGNGEEKRS